MKQVKRSLSMFMIFALIMMNVTPALSVYAESATNVDTVAEDLILSEYVEGSSFNKAIEIFNGTGEAVDLSNYSIELYSNGASSASQSLSLSGTLANGDAYVLAHPSADQAILDQADVTNGSVINFNGDDAVALLNNEEKLDVIGEIGQRTNFGQDVTLVRNASVIAPSTTFNVEDWTDYSQNTFAYIGSHTMDGTPGDPEDPEEPGDPEEPDPGQLPISDVRDLPDGEVVTVEGIVTADNQAISNGSQFTTYIQDETAGINLFAFEQGEISDVTKGDKVVVTGELATYNGLKEIVPNSLEVIDSGLDLPEAQTITLEELQDEELAESLEGQRVQVNGYIRSIPDSPAGGGYNITVTDADFNGTTLRVMENALDISEVEPNTWYDITAVVSQYNTYQLIPTEQADIQIAEEQPEPPSSEGYYETTVESVTDGDTIRVAEPVFGEKRVRFVNMDTAETYAAHNDDPERDEINDNQKYYGDLATDYIGELIQPGDEIYLKVGDEPTDDYGRILAEVIRKDDGLNVNLEMVEAGYASTYFIAPIDEEAYPEYQQAVKEAKDAELGIWNPENPLLELPFVFRANDDQKGFQRYVGNSDTMEYVVPDNWADVPVEHRIFFSSPEEAESYGYTPVSGDGGDSSEETLDLQLISMNDLHGKIDQEYMLDLKGNGESELYGRMDYTAAAIKEHQEGNEHSMLVHAGDMIGGSSPVSGLLQDEPTVEIMNAMGFDVGAVGNHEFDEGLPELLRMIEGGDHPEGKGTEGYEGMDFPSLCANCVYEDTGETFLPPYIIEEVDGEQIGFIGVNTQETVNMVMPSSLENVEFTDETEAVNDAAEELTSQGVEAIIVLAHMPATQNGDDATGAAADLARNVNDAVDVIFAGHNHVENNVLVDDKLIIQANEYGKAFADVQLVLDRESGDIIEKEAEIVYVKQSDYTPDAEVAAILDKYAEEIAPIINEVIGYNAQDLTGDYTNDGDHGLGNLISDGMNEAMDSDFAFMNGGGIRDDLLAGDVTWGDLYNIQPFGNTLMTVEVTGNDIYEILNEQIHPEYGPDYSVSDLHYTWNPELGEVINVTFPDGTPIDLEETYVLTVNNYMGTSEGPIKDLGENPTMGPADIDATVEFIQAMDSSEANPIVYEAEGRITQTDEEPGDPEDPSEPDHIIEAIPDRGLLAFVRTRDLLFIEDGSDVVIDISNESRLRMLLLTLPQVYILKNKEVTLHVTNGEETKTFDMAEEKLRTMLVLLTK